jgi:hypothetical protein
MLGGPYCSGRRNAGRRKNCLSYEWVWWNRALKARARRHLPLLSILEGLKGVRNRRQFSRRTLTCIGFEKPVVVHFESWEFPPASTSSLGPRRRAAPRYVDFDSPCLRLSYAGGRDARGPSEDVDRGIIITLKLTPASGATEGV